ncbi:LOW QUALITY PROTEIN: prokineticin-1 [Molossus nigricans]
MEESETRIHSSGMFPAPGTGLSFPQQPVGLQQVPAQVLGGSDPTWNGSTRQLKACEWDVQCGTGTCCAISPWLRGARTCNPWGRKKECQPGSRKVPFFRKRQHHTCPCLPSLLCSRCLDGRYHCSMDLKTFRSFSGLRHPPGFLLTQSRIVLWTFIVFQPPLAAPSTLPTLPTLIPLPPNSYMCTSTWQ